MDPAMAEATRHLARLRLHYPTILPSDERLAAPLAADWLKVISETDDPEAVTTWLIESWDRERAPRLADWKRRASGGDEPRVRYLGGGGHDMTTAEGYAAVAGPPAPIVSPEERAAILAEIETRKDEARMERARMLAGPGYSSWTPLLHPDTDAALEPMLTFDQVYPEQANEKLTDALYDKDRRALWRQAK